MLKSSTASIIDIARADGVARAVKSTVRHVLFDGIERKCLDRALRCRGVRLKIDRNILLVGHAANYRFPVGSIDFIYSEDVFEHIPPGSVERPFDHNQLLAVVRRNSGDHAARSRQLARQPPNRVVCELPQKEANRPSSLWEHLRQRHRVADCYLNELKLSDYRRVFDEQLDVLDEIDMDRDIGAAYLDPVIEAEFSGYKLKELVGPCFRFILKRPAQA